MFIIHRPFRIFVDFFLRTSQSFRQPINTPIVISIFQRAGRTLINPHIIRHVSQLVIILIAQTSSGRSLGMHVFSPVHQSRVQRLDIGNPNPFQISIRQNRSRIIPDHTSPVSRTRPFWEKTAFLVRVNQPLLNLPVSGRVNQIQQRKQATEGIPEPRIRIHVSR